MIYCGITGHTGNLGKKIQKVAKNFKFIKFKGDIRRVKNVEAWIKNNNFDLIIHFAAIVPISKVNKKYKHATLSKPPSTLIKVIIKPRSIFIILLESILIKTAERLFAASSKVVFVLVLGSKNKLAIVFPSKSLNFVCPLFE